MEMDSNKAKLGLAGCYKLKYGEERPAADKDVNWDGYDGY